MVWAVKYSFEHWNEDVLLLLHLGIPENIVKMVEDPRVTSKLYLRSDDRNYAEIYMVWENKASFDEWRAQYPDWNSETGEMQKYLASFGITRNYYEPPAEDFPWTEHPSHRPDKVQYPKNVITHMDIFTPPDE